MLFGVKCAFVLSLIGRIEDVLKNITKCLSLLQVLPGVITKPDRSAGESLVSKPAN